MWRDRALAVLAFIVLVLCLWMASKEAHAAGMMNVGGGLQGGGVSGGPSPPVPGTQLATQAGDLITTESGDVLVTEEG